MSTDFDTRLREDLRQHLADVSPPGVDVAALVGRGRRARGLRWTGAFAATVTVAAMVTAMAWVLPGDDGPSQVDDGLAVVTGGAQGPSAVPGPTGLFVTATQVFMGGQTYDVRLPWDTGAHVSANGVAYPARGSSRPLLLGLDGAPVPLAPADPQFAGSSYGGWVAADSGGGLVAWAEQTEEAADIVAFDTSTMTEVGRKRLPCQVGGMTSGCPVPYIVSGGQVFVFVEGGTSVWDPASDTASDILPGAPAQAHNHVLTGFEGEGFPAEEIGPGWEQANVPENMEGILSFDGTWVLDANGHPKVVNWRDPAQTIRYRVPGEVQAAVFDTDGSVLVVTSDGKTWTGWDCALGGRCEQVVSPRTDEIRVVAWDL